MTSKIIVNNIESSDSDLTLSSAGASDLVISAIASCGDVTPRNTLPKVGLITEAAPNNNCPTFVSLNFFFAI